MLKKIILFLFVVFTVSESKSQFIILGDLVISKSVAPGDTVRETIRIKNAFNKTKKMKIYLAEYKSTCENGQQFITSSDYSNTVSNKKWIKFSPEFLILPAGAVSRVNIEMHIPPDTMLSGSYISMIMVEEDITDEDKKIENDLPSITPKKLNEKKKQNVEIRAKQNVRYAFQLITNFISKPGSANISIKNIKIFKSKDNHRILQFDCENSGSKLIKPNASAEIFNSSTGFKVDNLGKDKFLSEKRTISPYGCARYSIDMGILTYGLYKIQIIVDGGGDDVWGQVFNVNIN